MAVAVAVDQAQEPLLAREAPTPATAAAAGPLAWTIGNLDQWPQWLWVGVGQYTLRSTRDPSVVVVREHMLWFELRSFGWVTTYADLVASANMYMRRALFFLARTEVPANSSEFSTQVTVHWITRVQDMEDNASWEPTKAYIRAVAGHVARAADSHQ